MWKDPENHGLDASGPWCTNSVVFSHFPCDDAVNIKVHNVKPEAAADTVNDAETGRRTFAHGPLTLVCFITHS